MKVDFDDESGEKKNPKEVDLTMDPIPSDTPIDTKKRDATYYTEHEDLILAQCVKRMDEASNYWRPIFDESRKDIRFLYEEQWPEEAKAARKNRPMLTLNQLPQYVYQVVNQARRTKFDINVKQLSGRNIKMLDRENVNRPYSRSQIMEGLVRDIEYRSKAHNKYCTALQHTAESGMGFLRVNVKEAIDDPWNVEIRVENIKNRFCVLMDPPDGRDDDYDSARYVGMYWDMDRNEFKERFGEIDATAIPAHDRHGGANRFNTSGYWDARKDTVRITDYWWKEPEEREVLELIAELDDGNVDRMVVYREDVKDVLDELKKWGYKITRRKKIKSYMVKFIRCIYNHILEGPIDWPSSHLPIVPVVGREVNLPEQDVCVSLHRFAHDGARMMNYWYSAATEKMALSPKEPFLLTPDQIAGLESYWDDQTKNRPYLLYNFEPDQGSPTRQPTSQMATGELQMLQSTRSIMQDTIGVHDAQMGQKSNEVSGRALENRQDQGMTNTFDFVDNLSRAVVQVGEILVDMIPRVYTSHVVRQVILPDDSSIEMDLNYEIKDEQTGRTVRVNSLDYGRFSCRVATGPSNATLREDFTTIMMEWGRTDPEGLSLVRDLLAANMDIPNASAFAERFKAAVPPNLLSKEDRERQPPPEPTQADKIAMVEAQAKMKQAEADMKQAEADIAKAEASERSFQYRAEGDMAKRDIEVEKGLNKSQEHVQKLAEGQMAQQQGADEGQIEKMVQRMVKQAMAQALAKAGPKTT